jgi:hypothetical protein
VPFVSAQKCNEHQSIQKKIQICAGEAGEDACQVKFMIKINVFQCPAGSCLPGLDNKVRIPDNEMGLSSRDHNFVLNLIFEVE